jgi:hypothetical protein
MKQTFFIAIMLTALNLYACAPDKTDIPEKQETETPDNGENPNDNGNSNNNDSMKIKMTFGDNTLTATLLNNETARAFVEKLPLTLHMQDLYSREMCYRFPEALPANEVSTRGYEVGEIIYWTPGRSFVIMYKQNGERFAMQSMGHVDSNVEIFNTTGDVDIRFEISQ